MQLSPARATALLIVTTAAIRLAVAGATGLGVDESFMVTNARSWAWSTVDHPPLHVWIVGAWARLWGTESAAVLRIPFVAMFAGSTALMYRLTASAFGDRAGMWAAVALNLAPAFTLSAGTWILPDGPLVLFALAAACLLAPAPSGRSSWVGAGVCAGLALLSKYHAAFLLVGTFAALATTPEGRRTLRTPGPWVAVAVALALFAPVALWNLHHDWIGLRFQADRLASPSVQPLRLLGNLGGQAAYLGPWLAPLLALALVRALARGPEDPGRWWLAVVAVGPIAVFSGAALLARGLPHWSMPGWLFAIPLLGAWCAERPRRWVTAGAVGSGALVLALVAALSGHAATGWISRVVPGFTGRADPTVDLVDWDALPDELRRRGLLDEDTVVASTHWTEAAKASYALGDEVPVLCLCAGRHQFALRPDARGHEGEAVLLVGTERLLRDPGRWFERVEALAPVVVTRGGEPVLTLEVRRGVGLKPGYLAR